MPRRSLVALFAAALIVVIAAPPAAAKRIAVLEIEGARTPRLRRSIVRLLRPHDTTSAQAYRNASKRLRAVKLTPNNVAKVARYLEAEGVVDGTLVAEDGGYRLTIRLRAGSDGLITKKVAMRLSEPRLDGKMAKGLEKRLKAAIDDLAPLGSVGDAPVGDSVDEGFIDEKPKRMSRAERRREARRKKREARAERRRAAREAKEREAREREARERGPERVEEDELEGDFEDDFADEELEDDFADEELEDERVADVGRDDDDDIDAALERDADDDDEPAAARDPRATPLSAIVGLSVTQRSLSFTSDPGLENAPLGYQGSPVPGVYVAGEAYPLAFGGSQGALANLGVTFLYDKVVQINSAVENPETDTIDVLPTTQQRWNVGAIYRLNFGSKATSPTVALLAGYGKADFLVDKSATTAVVDIPNVSYTYADPGLRFRIGATPNIFLSAEGRFMLVLGTGEMQLPEQYGAATVTGVDANAGIEYLIRDRYLVRVGAHYMRLGYAFQGNANQTDRNGDGETDVFGAADQYLGGFAAVGFQL